LTEANNEHLPTGQAGSPGKQTQRRLAAIMFTDMVGYSALSQKNEVLALELLEEHRKILRSIFLKYAGREIDTAGDSFFVEFISAVDAANCAIDIQTTLLKRNVSVEPEKQIRIRIGLHIGDVVQIGINVHGDGVNIAARLEPLCTPEGVCLSEDFARAVQNKLDYPVIKKGEVSLKNISSPMTIYCIELPWVKEKVLEKEVRLKASRKKILKYAVPPAILLILVLITLAILKLVNPTLDDRKFQTRIAVLPFANISQKSEDDYFADGITEEIISNLAKISGLDVIARTSIIKYKNADLSINQIGNELNVGTILEGSVRKAADKTRITVQLIDVQTQRHLWAETYDRELKDIFAIQSDIAMKVAEGLKVQLLANERSQIEKEGTGNMDAFRNYLLGNYYLNKKTGEAFNKAIEYFNNAIGLDPDFALAYSGLANCYTFLGGASYGQLSREEASVKANDAAIKALQLDESLAEAHASLGYIKFRFDWDWDGAEREFKKAIELKPGYAQAHEWYALFLALIRRSDSALIEMRRAYELDPLSPSISTGIGRILYFDNKLKEAIDQYKKTLEMFPNYADVHFALAMSYGSQRNINEALKELDKAIELSHGRLIMITIRGMIYGFAGRKKDALAIIEELKKLSSPDPVSPWFLASIYLSTGDKDKYFEFVNEAYEQKDALMVYIGTTPVFDPSLKNDPRFHDLLRKMRLD
jgi:TolB-like protein/class 3 adenylate cyclase/Tfp pilus assembly protein PilF